MDIDYFPDGCVYKMEIEFYPDYNQEDSWAQSLFLVRGYGDVLWTNRVEDVVEFVHKCVRDMVELNLLEEEV